MNVVLVTPWPLATAGGTQTLLRKAGAELLRRGHTVRAVAGERGVDAVASPISEERLPVLPAPRSRSRVGASRLDGLGEALARLRPDVVLYAPHHSTEAVGAAEAARALGVPFAYAPLVHLDHPSHVGREARAFARAADLVLCVTERERRWLAEVARVDAPVLVGAGSDFAGEPLPPPRAGPRRALVSVGSFERHKRLEDQLEALALAPPGTALTLAGRGEGEGRLRERIERLGLEGRARLAVGLPDAELRALLREADAFLFTSRSESFGLALLDAICLGTLPVVYPNAESSGLVAASGFGVVAERETPRALAEAILRARDVPRAAAPDPAFRRAHTWGAVGERLERALEGLVGSRAGRGDATRSPSATSGTAERPT